MQSFTLDVPRMGYIVLVERAGKDLIGGAIEKQQLAAGFGSQHAKYTHVVISGGCNSKCDKVYIVNIQPPKARLRDLLEAFAGRNIKVMRFKADADYSRIAYFAATLCDRPYDWLGVLKFKLGFLFQVKEKFFCSEGSAWAIRMEVPGFYGALPDYKIMPAHYSASDELETVWEGIIPKEV